MNSSDSLSSSDPVKSIDLESARASEDSTQSNEIVPKQTAVKPVLAKLYEKLGQASLTIEGAENLPKDTPIILVAPSVANDDGQVFRRAVKKIGVDWGLDVPSGKVLLAGKNPLKFSGRTLYRKALASLGKQKSVLLFPEGLPSPDGLIHRGNLAVAQIVIDTSAPVIPAMIVRTHNENGKLVDLKVTFGKELDLGRWRTAQATGLALQTTADNLIYALVDLSGWEYTDVDAEISILSKEITKKRDERKRRQERKTNSFFARKIRK